MTSMVRSAAAADAAPLVISGIDGLRALQQAPGTARHRALLIELPGVAEPDAHAMGERLTAYANECGCSDGAKSMTAAFAAALVWMAVVHGPFTSTFLWRSPWALLCAFAGAAAGKTVGILRARRRLRREIHQLVNRITDRRD
jgi:hypothetical protein